MTKIYFRQLLVGRDIARDNEAARSMENFVYLVGDLESKTCIVVDAAWDIEGIVNLAHKDGMKIVGALATHYHPDHIGGKIFGITIEGLAEVMAKNPCPVHAHRLEKEGIIKVTGLSSNDIIAHDSGDKVSVGSLEIELLHTPGHTPGSLCFRLNKSLLSGDTLFLRGCGRVDLPGGDVDEMYRTIHERFSSISNDTIVFPGHAYGGDHAAMDKLRHDNPVFSYLDIHKFRRIFN
jgi:hydroxyacylglutathione hydrolase